MAPFVMYGRDMSRPGDRLLPPCGSLPRISHQLTVEAHDRPAITSLRLLTVLNVGFRM